MPELSVPIRRCGALVKVWVRAGGAAVGPVSAFLDTGASDTMIEAGVLARLAAEPLRCAALSVLGREDASFHETFAVELALDAPGDERRWVSVTALGGPVFATGASAALGRDFLASVVVTYDGPNRRAVIRW